MTSDRKAEGTVNDATGKAKQAWGNVADDDQAHAEGQRDEATGKAKQALGDAKEKAGDLKDKVSDSSH